MVEIIIALIGAGALLANTLMNRKTSKRLKTGNGIDVGALAEQTYYKVEAIDRRQNNHEGDPFAHG